ncbi:unnamed protein product [Lymnaea stagnalis]|uniref:Asparagine synthetase domain-containing protein 1 n=1 Tax=Lymnaea stagnalis TaxID=6523 RepID=A0AAV2H7X3_LYMST
MCGICFACCLQCPIITESKKPSDESTHMRIDFDKESSLNNRGPDVSLLHTVHLTETCQGTMQGCVLHLRGDLTPQPVTDKTGNALLWNGEIFDGIPVKEDENDTQILFDVLAFCVTDENILTTLQKIHGPWAFIYWQAKAKKLWFGRDIFGRRSLLWHLPSFTNDQFILASVATTDMVYTEIPCVGVFCLNFCGCDIENRVPSLTLHPWKECRWPAKADKVIDTPQENVWTYLYPAASTHLHVNIDTRGLLNTWIPAISEERAAFASFIPDFDLKKCGDLQGVMRQIIEENKDLDSLADELIQVLLSAVKKRVTNLPRKRQTLPGITNVSLIVACVLRTAKPPANVAILFSGGLDSTVLAALADRCIPQHETIDLLNVAFEQTKPMEKVKSRQVKNKIRGTGLKGQSPADDNLTTTQLASSESPSECLNGCQASLNNSVCAQISIDVPTNNSNPGFSHLAISGRTNDSLSTKPYNNSCPVVINNGHIVQSVHNIPDLTPENDTNMLCVGENRTFDAFNVPDRQTARVALSELNPNRNWNFVEINISQAEAQTVRQSRIRKLIYPLHTVLDDSIGCAVWFAARGSGILASDKGQDFTSKARVILCGMAADEQFAGYSRHRVTYKTKGYDGLVKEVQEEMWRISSRNLGRDDRIITDHGKESRFPFLDETFIQFCSTIPVFKRADLTLPRGVGEKLLLRICAYKLGLQLTALQPKRAIQFGSKIAKMDNKKEKGSDICHRLK